MALLIVFGGNTDTEQVVEKACAKLVGSYDALLTRPPHFLWAVTRQLSLKGALLAAA